MAREDYRVGQTIQIDLVMDDDISGAGVVQVKYRKPSGAAAAAAATVVDAELGWIRYVLPAASVDEDGDWAIWAYAVRSDGSIDIGDTLTMRVNKEGY